MARKKHFFVWLVFITIFFPIIITNSSNYQDCECSSDNNRCLSTKAVSLLSRKVRQVVREEVEKFSNVSIKSESSKRISNRNFKDHKFPLKKNEIERSPNQTKQILRIHLAAIHVDKAEFPLSKLLFKLALRLALDTFSEQLEQEHRIKLLLSIRSANTCSHQFAGAIAAEEYYTKRARLFIVSGCDEAIRAVSRLASQWQVPIMTAAGFSDDLNNKSVHKTLLRVAFSLRAAVDFLFKIMKSFQWRRINLIVDESDPNGLALRGSIEDLVRQYSTTNVVYAASARSNTTLNSQQQYSTSFNIVSLDFKSLMRAKLDNVTVTSDDNQNRTGIVELDNIDNWPTELMQRAVRDALYQCSMFSRVSILLIPQRYMRKFMLSVYDQNMANGLYTFINLPLLVEADGEQTEREESSPMRGQSSRQLSYSSSTGDNVFLWRVARSQRNSHAKQAFESLMSIYLRTPSTKAYIYFANRLINLANLEYGTTTTTAKPVSGKNLADNLPAQTQSKQLQLYINPYLASFYDSLQIYIMALNESLVILKHQHQLNMTTNLTNISDLKASNINKDLNKNNLHGMISELVRNRRYDNMVTGHIYINSNGDRETDYTLDDMNEMTGKFAPVILYRGETQAIERLGRIHWSSDSSIGPTSDTVDCNLTLNCSSKPMNRFALFLTLAAPVILLVISSLSYLVFNHLRLESQLVDYWWKIHMNEIEIVLTRRRNANDGSVVMTASSEGHGGGIISGGTGVHLTSGASSISPQEQFRNMTAGSETGTKVGGGSTMLIGSGSRFKSSTVINDGKKNSDECNKTEITNTSVGQWGQASSVNDVCYGDISLGIYKQCKVALKPIGKFHQSRKLMVELRGLKDISHANLCRFVGLIIDEGSWGMVVEFCPKGSLRQFFQNESMIVDWTFKYSIINDIMAGLTYLHSSALQYHGRLKSSNCLVNARFVVKLSDYGPHSLYEQFDRGRLAKILNGPSHGDTIDNQSTNGENNDDNGEMDNQKITSGENSLLQKLIWLAPEHMNPSSKTFGSVKGDIYAFGLLLYEIITNTLPFFDPAKDDFVMPLRTLCHELKCHGPNEITGPHTECITDLDEAQNIQPMIDLMKLCWQFEPSKRPNSQEVNACLKKMTRGVTSKKLLQNLTTRMEQYTNNLEALVETKLTALVEEKLRTEELLYQFVPKSIAALLKEGQFFEPEAFECVTVFYSDIVGFTSLSSQSTPMEVVDFLSELYLCFDETLEQHDIYKVDTIGDAYIVASGLPQRNGNNHVIEIACAALELRDRLRSFKVPHKPGHSLKMRVGIHSGPCVAGIVGGLNMPKYCVFGDTLNVGKFMESTGLPMKIHITEESKNLLNSNENFIIEARQPKITRDGLPLQTYWLEKNDNGYS